MSVKFTEHINSDLEINNELVKDFQKVISRDDIGFIRITSEASYVEQSKQLALKFKDRENFYHFGIGGSSLGPKMMVSALKNNDKEFHFIENIDSDSIFDLVNSINFEKSVLFFVSKSGNTAETLAMLSIVLNKFKDKKISESIVIATEDKNSALKQLQEEHNLSYLEVPLDVGGRFSALTNVGLFPLSFAGVDCSKLLEGAKSVNVDKVSTHATVLVNLYQKGITHTVFMPYSDKLKFFSHWFVQLWAESLGKDGKGPTPMGSLGATDQHSTLQLFTQGPDDKFYYLLELEQRAQDLKLENSQSHNSFKNLSHFTLNQLMKAEYEGTAKSLLKSKRNLIEIKVKELTPQILGELILYFEVLTVMTGMLLKVDPFNQPGVEDSKKFAWEWLNSHLK